MSSTAKLVAEALAYRWGEMQEEPPGFIENLFGETPAACDFVGLAQ